ncbi:hypothetical protein GCM10010300_33900 [Streptomyces olivaceoviridis]|nr:hypothetical protein GCM10010300_33900 [Streptomyces olivaceoviridis]
MLAEVLRSGVNAVERGQGEAAFALGMRKAQVMAYVLVPQAVPAVLPAVISRLVVTLKDTSLGFLTTCEEFLHAGKLIASILDYDLPFIPVVMVISPICIGMCMLLSWFADRVSRRERRSPRTTGVAVAAPGPGALLPGGVPPTAPKHEGGGSSTGQARPAAAGDHCSPSGTDTYDGSSEGEEKVSCAPDGLCSA